MAVGLPADNSVTVAESGRGAERSCSRKRQATGHRRCFFRITVFFAKIDGVLSGLRFIAEVGRTAAENEASEVPLMRGPLMAESGDIAEVKNDGQANAVFHVDQVRF